MEPVAAQETVLDAGTVRSRLARIYAESLLVAAGKQGPDVPEAVGAELAALAAEVAKNPDIAAFLGNPTISKRVKDAALAPALQGASELLRGLLGVLAQNARLDLFRNIVSEYRRLLDVRAGRIPVWVTAAVALTDAQRSELVSNLRELLGSQDPVLRVSIDPELLGGLVVRVGDSVIDTSVRSRLQSLRSLLLARS
jgi:F-type H+-transporting ATPase subunit delta